MSHFSLIRQRAHQGSAEIFVRRWRVLLLTIALGHLQSLSKWLQDVWNFFANISNHKGLSSAGNYYMSSYFRRSGNPKVSCCQQSLEYNTKLTFAAVKTQDRGCFTLSISLYKIFSADPEDEKTIPHSAPLSTQTVVYSTKSPIQPILTLEICVKLNRKWTLNKLDVQFYCI